VTFAAHLLYGAYLLGSLALNRLADSSGRLVFVSSGGMYLTPFPAWEQCVGWSGTYDGQLAYSYMKRGQILLAEQWAQDWPAVKVVSCHPGWSGTPGVDAAFGEEKNILAPLRTVWEGAEGICWLLSVPVEELSSGAFYLDREPQFKHIAGPFFTEGTYTKNSPEQKAEMMQKLRDWTCDKAPTKDELVARHSANQAFNEVQASKKKLEAMEQPIELQRFMGSWYIHGAIPSLLDKNTVNGIETYTWNEAKSRIDVKYTFMNPERTKQSCIDQTAVPNNAANTEWKLRVTIGPIPVTLRYLIVACDDQYETCIVGDPDRRVLYIMAQSPNLGDSEYAAMMNRAEELGYKRTDIKRIPQIWDTVSSPELVDSVN
jgi:lipocalin